MRMPIVEGRSKEMAGKERGKKGKKRKEEVSIRDWLLPRLEASQDTRGPANRRLPQRLGQGISPDRPTREGTRQLGEARASTPAQSKGEG